MLARLGFVAELADTKVYGTIDPLQQSLFGYSAFIYGPAKCFRINDLQAPPNSRSIPRLLPGASAYRIDNKETILNLFRIDKKQIKPKRGGIEKV
jgi:hypothetical protein